MGLVSAWDDWDKGASNANVIPLPLRAMPARLPDPSAIPPRPWLYGTILQRGYVTVVVAPGGVGKTQAAMAIALCLVTGQPFLGHHIHHRANAWLLNLEDPLDEMDRRLAALMIYHRVARSDVAGSLFMHSGRDRRVCLATRDSEGQTIVYPDKDAIIEAAQEMQIGLIVVDPFVKSHGLAENSNEDMDAAATAWGEIAEAIGCAILLVHHVRKGPTLDIDAARGASALIGAARAAYLLQSMSEQEADELGVSKQDRWKHIRMDDGKSNMAPRAAGAEWFRMEMVPLGNATSSYPKGDLVAALSRWEPPDLWTQHTSADINAALDEIDAGHPKGGLYVAHKRGRSNDRWAGTILIRLLSVSEAQAANMISTWMDNGLLFEKSFRDPDQRREKTGVYSDISKRPTE